MTRDTDLRARAVVAQFIAHEVAGRPDSYVHPSSEMYIQAEELLTTLRARGFTVIPVAASKQEDDTDV